MPPSAPAADPPVPHPSGAPDLHRVAHRRRETTCGCGKDGAGAGGLGGQRPGGGTGSRPATAPEPLLTEAIVVPRLIVTACANGAGEAERLARDAGLPNLLAQTETVRAPSARTYQLWGAVLARTGRADAGLLAAAGHRPGMLDVFDYLMTSAPTVGDGLAHAASHLHLISSNSLLQMTESGDEVTISYDVRRGDDELRWVVAEFALGATGQLRYMTGQELSPVRVEFTHRAPVRQAAHHEAFGSARLEFGAAVDGITLHRRDLERPLATADPALAAIMLRAAAAIPPPRMRPSAPVPGLRDVIAAQLPYGRPSLNDAARHLAISPRTLQRRLGDSGTTWRAELDTVRREQSDGLRNESKGSAQRAARLGFAESRSLRRAMNRWDADARDGSDGTGTGTGAGTGTGTGESGDDAGNDVSRTEREAGRA